MSMKNANYDIGCGVKSCTYHCGDREYCSLGAIKVDPCPNCGSGKSEDESMCASYRAK